MARATSSLPVPLSPVISTGTSQAAKRRTCSNTSNMTGLLPTMKSVGASATGSPVASGAGGTGLAGARAHRRTSP